MKRFFVFVLTSICLINLAFAQQMATIDPELYALMNSKSGEKINVNIILKEKVDASELNVRSTFSSRDDKRAAVVEELKARTEKSQADLMKTLNANERSIQVTDIKCYWITNMITCNATPDAILKIAEHPDVEAVFYNKKQKLIYEDATQSEVVDKAVASEDIYNGTNVEKVNAHQVWDLGFRGEDIIVAVIDSGVNTEHEDLNDHLWDDGNGNHGYNTLESNYDISDGSGHGTHCAGTVCGDGTSGTITGMAPDATLMVVKVLDSIGAGTPASVIAGVQYAVENGAHVMSLSIGFSYAQTPTREAFRDVFANALEAGVVAAVAAGNDGDDLDDYPTPYNINAPGDCPPPYLSQDKQSDNDAPTSVISVGAVNYNDEPCEFSSEGPVTWQGSKFADYPLGSAYSTKNIGYDNGVYSHSLSDTEASKFAVMFPPSMLTQFVNGGTLKSVSIYAGTNAWGGLYIYKGGETPESGTKLYENTYSYSQTGSMMDLVLKGDGVQIDVNQNLWIVFNEYTEGNIIPLATNTGNSNACWISKLSGAWTNSQVSNMIMVRANISTSNDTEEKIGLIRPDVCAPGYMVQSTSADYPSFYYDYMSGTSQATPCVAGTIALLLDANPDLTPADICRVLEETAVKVGGATTKSNKTGSGRIDAYNAVLAVATDLPLAAPTLTATAKSSSQIDLSWTVAPGADSYTIYRDESVVTSVTTTSYSDKGLNPETAYSYYVKAVRNSESANSNTVSVTTLSESAAIAGQYRIKESTSSKYLHINSYNAPGATNATHVIVSDKADSNNQIFTIEDAGNGNYYLRSADGYYIKCDDQANSGGRNWWSIYAYSQTTDRTPVYFDYTDASKSNFYIRDYDKKVGNGNSQYNTRPEGNCFQNQNPNVYCDASQSVATIWTLEPVSSSTPDPEPETAPDAPQNLAATAESSTSIALSWDAVDGATSYNVYRNSSVNPIVNVATGTSYTDTNLTPATNYCYTVSAVNANGESAKSTQACATTLATGSAVEQEVTIGGDVNSNNTSSGLPINAYYRYTFSQQIYTQSEIGTGAGTITKLAFKKQTDRNANRKIKVYMQNTSKANFTNVKDWVSMTDADKVFDGEVDLSGANNDLELTLNTPFSYTGENLLISVCDYTGTDVTSTYFYTYSTSEARTIFVRSDGTSYDPSNMSSIQGNLTNVNNIIDITIETVLSSDVPSSPENLVATVQGTTSISLTWNAVDGATSYNVYRNSSVNPIVNVATGTSYTDTNLTPATNYCYTVSAVNANVDLESEKSAEVCETTEAESETPSVSQYRIKAVGRSASAGVSYYLNIENNDQHQTGSKGGVGLATYAEKDSQIFEIEEFYGTSVYLKSATGYYIYCNGGWNVDAYSTTTGTSLELQDAGNGTYYIYSSKGYFKVDKEDGGTNYYPYSNGSKSDREKWLLEPVGSSTPDPEPEPEEPTVPDTPSEFSGEVSIGYPTTLYNKYMPLYAYYEYNYSQQIYTKAEIDPNGTANGSMITKIAFKHADDIRTTRTIEVYVQNVTDDRFKSASSWIAISDANKVFDGDLSIAGKDEDVVIEFNEPLQYTGNNLLISVFDKTNSYITYPPTFYTYAVDDRSVHCYSIPAFDPKNISTLGDGEMESENNSIVITFEAPAVPEGIEFSGSGNWNDATNWSTNALPDENSNVSVSGDVIINGDVTVKTLVINDEGSVTVESGKLTVTDGMTNNDASAFIINDGAQVVQGNDNVKATFLMNVEAPESWTEDHSNGWQFIASPMKDFSSIEFETEGIDYDLFKYDGTQELQWVNYKIHGTDFEAKLQQGRGYLASYATKSDVAFEGTLNNERSYTFSDFRAYDEGNHYANFYLLGNPFTFNIEWDNMICDGIYNGGFATVDEDGSISYAGQDADVAVGDGFMVYVDGSSDQTSLSYSIEQVRNRRHHADEKESLNIIASNKKYGDDNVVINFSENDKGFAKFENFNKDIAEIYVKNDGRPCGILGFDKDTEEIELCFDAKQMGEYTINAITNGDFQSVILVDRFTANETELLTGSYTFTSATNENSERFTLRIKHEKENENFVYQSGSELVIDAEGLVQVMDVMGRIVYSGEQNGVNRINVSDLEKSTYVVRNINNNEVKTQKIVVF